MSTKKQLLVKKDMTGFLTHQDDNKALKDMDNQMNEMDQDYDVMLREKIESRKQLEAKFQDIARKIQANRDFTSAEHKRVKDTLKALQSKFEYKLKELRDNYEGKINAMRKYNREQFDLADKRLTSLEDAISKEVDDRITESDELIFETRDDLQTLQNQFDEECQTRTDREKDILQALDDEKYKLGKKIDAERTNKSLTLGKFRDDTNRQLKMQHKYVEEFQKDAMIEF